MSECGPFDSECQLQCQRILQWTQLRTKPTFLVRMTKTPHPTPKPSLEMVVLAALLHITRELPLEVHFVDQYKTDVALYTMFAVSFVIVSVRFLLNKRVIYTQASAKHTWMHLTMVYALLSILHACQSKDSKNEREVIEARGPLWRC